VYVSVAVTPVSMHTVVVLRLLRFRTAALIASGVVTGVCHAVLRFPEGVACSAFDELVVADTGNRRVVVFSASGELAMAMGDGCFRGVALHDSTIFATDTTACKCVVFS
jgi:hypothetical protein